MTEGSSLQATDNKWYWNLCIIEHGHTFQDLLMSALQIEFPDTFLIILK